MDRPVRRLEESGVPLLASYSAAVTDPDHVLIHLYDVREGLAAYHRTEETARTTLKISAEEWNRSSAATAAVSIRRSPRAGLSED